MIWEKTVFQKFSVLRNTARLTRHDHRFLFHCTRREWSWRAALHNKPTALQMLQGGCGSPPCQAGGAKPHSLAVSKSHCKDTVHMRTLLCSRSGSAATKEKPREPQCCGSGATAEHPVQGLSSAECRCHMGSAPTSLTKRL